MKKDKTEVKVTVDERGDKKGYKMVKKIKHSKGETKVIDKNTNNFVVETPRFAGLFSRGTPGTNLRDLPRPALRRNEPGSRGRGETAVDEMNANKSGAKKSADFPSVQF